MPPGWVSDYAKDLKQTAKSLRRDHHPFSDALLAASARWESVEKKPSIHLVVSVRARSRAVAQYVTATVIESAYAPPARYCPAEI